MQLCCKTSWRAMTHVSPHMSKPVLQLFQDTWIWLLIGWNYAEVTTNTWVTTLPEKQVCLKPVKRATWADRFCCKKQTTLFFLQQRFATCMNQILLSNCLNWKIYCDNHSSLSSTTAVQKWKKKWIISYILRINQICCKTGLIVGSKTRNIAIQLVLQQCCKTSCTFLLPVLPHPKKRRRPRRRRRRRRRRRQRERQKSNQFRF